MGQPISVGFEMKGGSPLVVEITTPDGRKFLMRTTLTLMAITWDGETMNPSNPRVPAFVVQAQVASNVEEHP